MKPSFPEQTLHRCEEFTLFQQHEVPVLLKQMWIPISVTLCYSQPEKPHDQKKTRLQSDNRRWTFPGETGQLLSLSASASPCAACSPDPMNRLRQMYFECFLELQYVLRSKNIYRSINNKVRSFPPF